VVQRGGPLLVIAGAGSGKTRVLTRRIAHILAMGDARPWEIMAITFTNKAADEMRRRVIDLVGSDAQQMWVSTFHSACLRMLRAHADVLGYQRGFTIYDAGDAETAVERIMKELNLDTKRLSPRSVAAAISAAKNEMLTPAAYADAGSGDDPHHKRIAEIYFLYAERLMLSNAMDFDDLLLNAVAMLNKDDAIRESYQHRFKYLLVDEFQDTNGVQNQLVMTLAEKHRNLCVVGDSDQSIYRFRAADVRNILQFEQRFPDAKVILLEQNFRSTQTILDAANAVIAKNASRHAKNLFTDDVRGEKIRLYRAGDEYDEGRWVATELRRLAQRVVAVVERDGGLLPDQRPESRARRGDAPRQHPVPGHLGHAVLRPQGDQECARLRATHRQPPRRSVGAAGHQRAQSAASVRRHRRSSASTPPSTRSPSPRRRTTPRRRASPARP
jgi:DNA helicase-2/ATP-dependent DNA helicase PcrA